jgi:hypothetical protein
MLKVFIHDQAGTELNRLQKMLNDLGVTADIWTRGVIPSTGNDQMLILTHYTPLRNDQKNDLKTMASQGAVVVSCSGTNSSVSTRAEGNGWVVSMSWQDLRLVLERVPRGFDLATFQRFVEAVEKRSVLDALAILSWCVTHEFDSEILRRHQEKWRRREQWLKVFKGVSSAEFFCACGVTSESELPATLRRFVDWIWPKTESVADKPPEFGKVLDELETKFNLR